jgi:predicted dehydrogenase
MNFGLIGIGKWGRNYIKVIQELESSKLIGCSSLNKSTFEALLVNKESLVWSNNWKDVLELNIDTLIISTQPKDHFIIAKEALKKGKNVICEKPCLFNNEEYGEIYSLQKNGVFFYTNYINHCISLAPEIKKSILENEYSNLYLANFGCGPHRD